MGGVSSFSASLESKTISAPSGENSRPLSPVLEEPEDNSEVDHTGNVEFDLLEEFGSLGVTSTSKIVLLYLPPIFKSTLGSVRSVSSSRITNEKSLTKILLIQLWIVDVLGIWYRFGQPSLHIRKLLTLMLYLLTRVR